MVRRVPQLSAAEQLAQLSIRKRATAFVDARDDLETKIGRLSRRLNFLMTESDLWREKFITFEHYAEKLSNEAAELRAKINKEQKESKRLSSLITLTATEKAKLEERECLRIMIDVEIPLYSFSELREVEGAHRAAMTEVEAMRTNMVKMEAEQAAMVAEVEAQIEHALQSMMMSESDPDDHDIAIISPRTSRPSSRRSSVTSGGGSRALRSFGTESTLAEDVEAEESIPDKQQQADQNSDEKVDTEPTKIKRFSATQHDAPGDGMNNVDENISERSDRISRKVLEIQQKVRFHVLLQKSISLSSLA